MIIFFFEIIEKWWRKDESWIVIYNLGGYFKSNKYWNGYWLNCMVFFLKKILNKYIFLY